MNTDFRIQIGLFTHPKYLKLHRQLGDSGAIALVCLFAYAAQNKPDGILTNADADDIAIASGYSGDSDAFVASLLKIRFLEQREDGVYFIHDWAEHNPWAVTAPARSDKARVAANKRWGNTAKPVEHAGGKGEQSDKQADAVPDATNAMLNNATSMQQASVSNAPLPSSPLPSSPNQKDTLSLGSQADDDSLPAYAGGREGSPIPEKKTTRTKSAGGVPRTNPDAAPMALFAAFRESRYPNKDSAFWENIPASEYRAIKTVLVAMVKDGTTPEQVKQATAAAMCRYRDVGMVTIPGISRHFTALLEDIPPVVTVVPVQSFPSRPIKPPRQTEQDVRAHQDAVMHRLMTQGDGF